MSQGFCLALGFPFAVVVFRVRLLVILAGSGDLGLSNAGARKTGGNFSLDNSESSKTSPGIFVVFLVLLLEISTNGSNAPCRIPPVGFVVFAAAFLAVAFCLRNFLGS